MDVPSAALVAAKQLLLKRACERCKMTPRKNCSGCRQAIVDPFVMEVGREHWHESCLTCQVCRTALEKTCYQRDGKLLCKADYDRLYGIKCSICNQLVPRRELVMRVLGNIYHLECFLCTHCGHALQKGEAFVIRNGKLICCMCLDREAMAFQHCMTFGPLMSLTKGEEENMLLISQAHTASETARRGPKRPRTILSSHQRRAFKTSFEVSPKPCRKVRESLAKDLGLSVRVVQVWFQNQRAKIKKLQRRQLTQTQQKSTGDSEKNDSDDDDDDTQSHMNSSAEEGLISSDDEKLVGEPLAEKRPDKPKRTTVKKSKSKEPTASADIRGTTPDTDVDKDVFTIDSLDSFRTLHCSRSAPVASKPFETSKNNEGPSPSSFADRMTEGQRLHPIDSLYSMQVSYFNS